MITLGSIYALYPRLLGLKQMQSIKLIDVHFWIHTVGVVLYTVAMWVAGIMQGLMWRATNADGSLTYTFVESLKATFPYYVLRVGGGLLVVAGMIIMLVNMWRTYRLAQAQGSMQLVQVKSPAELHAVLPLEVPAAA